MFEFGRRLAAERAQAPGDDIITQLAFEPLTQQDFDNYFVLLATAGNETTRHTITHGLLALLEHPDELERLRDDPANWVATRPRRCCAGRRPCTTSGARRRRTPSWRQAIKAGDKVTTWFVSGNRDEEVFEEPERVRRRPHPNRHMAFGPGGSTTAWAPTWRGWRCGSRSRSCCRAWTNRARRPAERLRSNFFNGIKRLPVRLTPA